jgi:membrane protein DedA with SNARE-associated domain
MTAEHLIQTYGYFALLLGALMEGETILVLAGFAASRGYLSLPAVISIASAATITVDQFFYFMGRIYGQGFLHKRPALYTRSARFREMLQRHQTPVIIGFRFMYGMRIVAPFAIGMSGITRSRFIALNIMSGLVWTTAFAAGGYCFGAALEIVLGNLREHEVQLILIIALAGALLWLGRFLLARMQSKNVK